METHFLDNFVKELNVADTPVGTLGVPWYNAHGDCVVFQTVDEATVAERVDDFLTIYRSAVDARPIGFQLKGVRALISHFGCEGLQVSTSLTGDIVISVRALLLAAYEQLPFSQNRRKGYATVPPPLEDEVKVDLAA